MSATASDITGCIFFGPVEERMPLIPFLMVIQFIYVTVVWSVIIGNKPGNSMTQLFTFFLSLFGTVLLFAFFKGQNSGDDAERKLYTKSLPWVAMFWLIHSFTTFICIFIYSIDVGFIEDIGGSITMLIFCLLFLCCWIQIFFAFNKFAE